MLGVRVAPVGSGSARNDDGRAACRSSGTRGRRSRPGEVPGVHDQLGEPDAPPRRARQLRAGRAGGALPRGGVGPRGGHRVDPRRERRPARRVPGAGPGAGVVVAAGQRDESAGHDVEVVEQVGDRPVGARCRRGRARGRPRRSPAVSGRGRRVSGRSRLFSSVGVREDGRSARPDSSAYPGRGEVDMLGETLRDPVVLAAPFFVVFIVLEARRSTSSPTTTCAATSVATPSTSVTMGLGSLVFTALARGLALLGYAALYELTPLRLDPGDPLTWVGVLLGVDLLWYLYTAARTGSGSCGPRHQAHHNSTYFNYSTAVRQKWNPWFEMLFWVPLPLLGVPPWMIFTAVLGEPRLPVPGAHRARRELPRPVELVFNTPSHHRVHHAQRRRVPRQELRRHPHRLGPPVRHVRRGGPPADLRADPSGPDALRPGAAVPRVRRDRARRAPGRRVARTAPGYVLRPPGWRPAEA